MNRREILGAAAFGTASLASAAHAASARTQDAPIRVLCWSEVTEPASVYPNGIHGAVAETLNRHPGIKARTASINDPEQGLSDSVLAETDVITWFGHKRHNDVRDDRVAAVIRRAREEGMGLFPLHSSHYSKLLKRSLNTSGDLGGVGDGGTETVYVVNPSHPIAKGVTEFTLPHEEFYDEPFGIPDPKSLVFFSVFGEKGKEGKSRRFRSGVCYDVGKGRLFYFRPGHEEYPTFFHPMVQKILVNGTLWLAQKT